MSPHAAQKTPLSQPRLPLRGAGGVIRAGRMMSIIGLAMLMIMIIVCLGTLPYTCGRANLAGTTQSFSREAPRRFEAIENDQALLPPFWASHTSDEQARIEALRTKYGQSAAPLLGTDRLGRSVAIRCLAGGAISLCVGIAAAALSVIIGTGYGMIAGNCGGRVDSLLMRIVDVLYGLPSVLLIVLLAVAVDGLVERGGMDLAPATKQIINLLTLLVAIGGVSWLTMARVIRGQVLSLKNQPFMEACRAMGVPVRRQLLRHLLPNLLGPIIVYATLTVPAAILSESFLSFLGIGVKEPLPSWGNLAAAGLSELNIVRARWWLLLWPCLLIAITLLSLNFVGEGLRERFDPKSDKP